MSPLKALWCIYSFHVSVLATEMPACSVKGDPSCQVNAKLADWSIDELGVQFVQKKSLSKRSQIVQDDMTQSAIFSVLAPKLPAEALVSLGAMYTLSSTSISSAWQPWYCVAQKSKKKVIGPFVDLEDAKAELNKTSGSSSNRQMICEMTSLGPKEDPHKVGDPEQNQGGGTKSGFNKWWQDYPEIGDMNKMCNADSACKAGPPWFCVPRIKGIDNKATVLGPFGDIESAKSELNKTEGSSSNPQMICEMTKSGAKSDPHSVGGQNQGGGTSAGFNKWWSNWNQIHQMNGMCRNDPACSAGDPNYDENELLKLMDAMIEEEEKSNTLEQPIIDAKINGFSKCEGMPDNDTAAEKKASDAQTDADKAADEAKTKQTGSFSLDFGSSESSASIEKAAKYKDIDTAHDAYTGALAAAAAAMATANQARESADDAHRLKQESKNMCFCNIKEAYDNEVSNVKKRFSSRQKKILLVKRVKCAITASKGAPDLYAKAFEVCGKESHKCEMKEADYKAKMVSDKMPTKAKCDYDNVWFCVAQISKKKVKGPFIDVDDARTYLNKKPGSGSNRQLVCEMSIKGAKSDPHWVGGKYQGGGAGHGFSGKYWYGWSDIREMIKMCNEDDACKKGYQ